MATCKRLSKSSNFNQQSSAQMIHVQREAQWESESWMSMADRSRFAREASEMTVLIIGSWS